MTYRSLGDLIHGLRVERSMTQRDVAGRAEITAAALSRIEKGFARPSSVTLERLARALNIPFSAFFESEQPDWPRLPSRHGLAGSSPGAGFLKVFLCHASQDKNAVRRLYNRLLMDHLEPWLDEENLLPGQEWEAEIAKTVRNSDVVLACLSNSSLAKSGFVQKEVLFALDVADEKPEGTVFIIPVKLEECDALAKMAMGQSI